MRMSSTKRKKGHAGEIDVEIGKRLKSIRYGLGISQTKLAELMGLSFQQVQKYERGTNRISASRLYELSQILGVPLKYFLENSEENMEDIGLEKKMHSKNVSKLVSIFSDIEDEDLQQQVIDFAKKMSKISSRYSGKHE